MAGNLTIQELKMAAEAGEIDTVLVCCVDMQGRLMGKRFHVTNFLESSHEETHCCNYMLATDLEMATPDGYATTSWQAGYGDYVMKPDLSTMRRVPWLEGTALVLCDLLDHHTHEPVPQSPRQILKVQRARLKELGYDAMMATELEFFLFEQSYRDLARSGYRDMTPISDYNEDYHILQTTKEEGIMRPVRNHLVAAGVPVENSKGEAETGQEELNIRYAEALDCADHHTIAKHAVKEIAWQHGRSVSFMAKWNHNAAGSSSHIHQALSDSTGKSVFYDPNGAHGMSKTMEHALAGLLEYANDTTFFLAPYVNSYKRFAAGTFAPTSTVWSIDNRTAGFRLVGEDTKGVRIECRIPGSDMNPYLASAAMLAAGLRGIREELPLPKPFAGDAYADDACQHVPHSLREAREALIGSDMLTQAFGADTIAHYARAAEWEIEEFNRVVTDYEIARGLEQA